jgi:hypothetical protein
LHHNIENVGFDVTWKEYEDGGHLIHLKYGVDDISAFLRKIIEVQLVNVAETAGVDAERKKWADAMITKATANGTINGMYTTAEMTRNQGQNQTEAKVMIESWQRQWQDYREREGKWW